MMTMTCIMIMMLIMKTTTIKMTWPYKGKLGLKN